MRQHAHALARRRRDAGYVRDNGFLDVALDEVRGRFFVGAADFAHHDYALGVRICLKKLEAIDEIHAANRIATNTNACRLAKTDCRGLIHGFVSKRARTGHHTDTPRLVDKPGHDANLAFTRRNYAGAVRSDQPAVIVTQC